jgi:hypothetical protein
LVASDELENHNDRLSKLEKNATITKLVSYGEGGGSDPTAILKALEDMTNEIKSECTRKFAPLIEYENTSS